jgi:murein DD-endopeptidase MepM/ murein hydrolase activator NlpD
LFFAAQRLATFAWKRWFDGASREKPVMGSKGLRPFAGAGGARVLFLFFLVFFSLPALAAPPELRGEAEQGGAVFGRAAAGAKVFLDGQAVPVDGAGRFVLGFARDAAPRAVLRVVEKSGAAEETVLAVRSRAWEVQRIDGLPQDKVTPPPALLERIAADNRAIAAARARIGGRADYLSGFVPPVDGIVSGVFGAQRVLNGEAKAPHSGWTSRRRRDAVRAAADGVVSLVHSDMFYTGRTVMIDHGLGLQTVYAHLSRGDVKVGQRVRRGQTIGAVGASGRATGPHLHWGASWLDRRLDPARLVEIPPVGQSRGVSATAPARNADRP